MSRGDRIRTCDHLVPNQERYRAALHPALFLNCGCKGKFFFLFLQTIFHFFLKKILFFDNKKKDSNLIKDTILLISLYLQSTLLYYTLFYKNFLQGLNATLNLFLSMCSHKSKTNQSIMRSTCWRNNRVNKYASIESQFSN